MAPKEEQFDLSDDDDAVVMYHSLGTVVTKWMQLGGQYLRNLVYYLQAMHEAGYVHRDIASNNILIKQLLETATSAGNNDVS